MLTAELIGAASVVAWIFLLFARGGFWRIRFVSTPCVVPSGKSVAVVIPARNEADVIGQAVASLLAQNYAGPIHIFVVDDHSTDGTAVAAGIHERLTIVPARPLQPGWTGKLWALNEGTKRAEALDSDYILLTDADIVHGPDNIAELVARAETDHLDLASLMVKLHCRTLAEQALIPAFVYFFFQLYPPAWIARRDRKTAGAAGGCILIRPSALARIGGIESIQGELIDDCALARAVKPGGNIWLGVTQSTQSIRVYSSFSEIRRMISRTAFTQLRHSVLALAATLLALAVIYLAPPFVLLARDPIATACGLTAWALMTLSYLPLLRFYGRSPASASLLPLVAIFYIFATLDSAIRYWSGQGGVWKDRVQDAKRGH